MFSLSLSLFLFYQSPSTHNDHILNNMTDTILPQSYGYGFIVGLGAAFALIMCLITAVLSKYMNQTQNSEHFTTASRSVNSGLISSAVVSSWVWPATLQTSGLWGYTYGISGGYLYGVMGGIQVLSFTQLAIEIKRIAPGCHTVAEIIKARYDRNTHFVYLFYITATNIMVSGCLLLGASQGFNASTGINIIAANFLLPLGVCAYTAFGGLKSTFISDWIHTVIIYFVVLIMCFKVFTHSDIIGSTDKFHDMLVEASEKFPPATGDSYLSFRNKEMFMVTWAVCIGGLSSVFGDPSYSQKAIAASPKGVLNGYVLGSACWMTIPWVLGTAGGLVCRALLVYPGFRTYPEALSAHDASAGLPVIYAFGTILGKSGSAAAVLNLFMSVTSAMSAELIAFSSVATFDVYRGYINPVATGKQLVNFGHLATIGFSIFVACVSVIFNYVGVTVGWLISFYGIILAPAIGIITYSLYWKKTSSFACTYGAPLATIAGLLCWVGTAKAATGSADKDSLMSAEACLVGNFVAVGSTFIFIPIVSYLKPNEKDFDFKVLTNAFIAGDDADEKEIEAMAITQSEEKELKRASKISLILNAILLIGAYVILPVSLYTTNYQFSKAYLKQWIIIMIMCLTLATGYIAIFPVYQGRHEIVKLFSAVMAKTTVETIDSKDMESSVKEEAVIMGEKGEVL